MTERDSIPGTVVPPTLYKYCSPERIDILDGLQIRFSRPSEFNDTFDTHFLVPSAAGSRAKVERSKFMNRVGILCLTERPDNHLMWVNYAQNHAGFVLGLDTGAPFFNEGGNILRKVIYQPRPNVLPTPNTTACFYKSPDWQYEQEWRCVREFQRAEDRFAAIEISLITQIIFGHRMQSWHISQIMQYVAGYGMNHVEFFLSSPLHSQWEFVNKPKTVSPCAACGGNGYSMRDRG